MGFACQRHGALGRASFLILLLIGLAGPAFADWDEALAAYNRGDYPAARNLLAPLLEQGEPRAHLLVAEMYIEGRGVEKDLAKARTHCHKAAEAGLAGAQNLLGHSLMEGQGGPADPSQAITWFERAAEQGDVVARYNLGSVYYFGRNGPRDLMPAMQEFKQAANQGYASAQFMLFRMYILGEGVAKNPKLARFWLWAAAAHGHTGAMLGVAHLYREGKEGIERDPAAAVRWYERAAEQRNTDACLALAVMYFDGEGVPRDAREAIKWAILAPGAEAGGDPNALGDPAKLDDMLNSAIPEEERGLSSSKRHLRRRVGGPLCIGRPSHPRVTTSP